jgi:hypothetical protein
MQWVDKNDKLGLNGHNPFDFRDWESTTPFSQDSDILDEISARYLRIQSHYWQQTANSESTTPFSQDSDILGEISARYLRIQSHYWQRTANYIKLTAVKPLCNNAPMFLMDLSYQHSPPRHDMHDLQYRSHVIIMHDSSTKFD